MASVLGITKERYVSLGDTLWHSDELAEPVEVFPFGEERLCADIEALTLPSEQRTPPPARIPKRRSQEGKSNKVDVLRDAQLRALLGLPERGGN